MARPKKTNALTPAQRKAASRERRKSSGLVRLTTEPEFYTVELLRRLAKFLNKTVSEVVTDIVAACRNKETLPNETGEGVALDFGRNADEVDEGEPRIGHVTRDANTEQVNLDLPADVHAWLTTREGLSACSVIEMIVNMRCFLLPEEFIGAFDSGRAQFTEFDFNVRRMVYAHPGDTAWLRTEMNALTRDDRGYTKAANKYERRRNTVTEYARAASVNRAVAADNEPFGNAHLNRALDAAMARRQEQLNTVLWERYYDASFSASRYDMGASDD